MLFEKVPAKLPHTINVNLDESFPESDDSQRVEEFVDAGVPSDEPDRIPRELKVERYHILCFTISILSYLFDIGSDVFVGVNHFLAGREVAALFVAVFAIVPSLVLNIVSFAWSYDDKAENNRRVSIEEGEKLKKKELTLPTWILFTICVFQFGPIWWHYKALYYALKFRGAKDDKSKRFWFCRMIEAERDATLLRLFEGLLESAPQLVVQSTVLSQFLWMRYATKGLRWDNLPNITYAQIGSLTISLFSMCWSITSQHRTIRMARPDKVNVHPHETILQLIWRALTVLSRILVVVLAVLYFGYWVIVLAVVHYLISLFHIAALQSIDTGIAAPSLEVGILLINAFIHSFTPFNTAEGNTRYRYLTAYLIEFGEAVIVIFLAVYDDKFTFPWKLYFCGVAAVAYALGILTMILYYSCFHPNRRRHKRITTIDGEERHE